MKSRNLASCLLVSAGLVLASSWSARADSSEAPSSVGSSSDKKSGRSSSSDSKGSSDSKDGRRSSSDSKGTSSSDSTGGRSSSDSTGNRSSSSDSTVGRSSGGSNSSESDSTAPSPRENEPKEPRKTVGKGRPAGKSAPGKEPKEPKQNNDPPGTDKVRKSLDDWFAKHDLNNDGYLDRQELAKAMKYLSTWKDAPKDGEGNPTNLPRSVMARKDYKLFASLDGNNDQKISKEEFDIWAKDYAVELAKYNNDVASRQKQQARTQMRIMDPLSASYLDALDAKEGSDKAPSPFKKTKKKLRP